MGTYNSAMITTAGQALLARTLADSLPFYFTTAKTTEYIVPSGTSAASLTELPNIKQSEEITSATVSGTSQVVTSVRFSNDNITLDYSINTIGVYAKAGADTEETLLAVITAQTADVMPSYSATNPVAYVYSINLAISNAANINIVISPTGTVNVAEFNDLKERVNELIESGSGLSTDAKMALLACFQKVAWIDDQGQTYYDTLYDALFPSAVSISATFSPGSHVFYETDSLDALRPYLVVRATMPDSTVKVVTDYFLTGTLTVGTNTITVLYQGLTDTFTVTAQADPAYITAVYTQPQTPVYTDYPLDDLKTDLVVTYYADAQAQGVVLSANQYTLSGTLVDGTNTVGVAYGNYTTTFSVTAVNRIIYALPSATTLNGTDQYIDTGVALLESNRSYTIAFNITDTTNYSVAANANKNYFTCYKSTAPYAGLYSVSYDGGSYETNYRKIRNIFQQYQGGRYIFDDIVPASTGGAGRIVKAVLTYDSSTGNVNCVMSSNGTVITPTTVESGYTYQSVSNTLTIGARKTDAGTYSNFFQGTVNEFVVYNYVFSQDEINAYVGG